MSDILEQHVRLLGTHCKDKITGVKGVITSICFDLYGCIQACVTPNDPDKDSKWVDVTRLIVGKRKIPMPNYNKGYIAEGKKGAADKPLPTINQPQG